MSNATFQNQFPQAQLTPEERYNLIAQWQEKKKLADQYKAEEQQLRARLAADDTMFDPSKKEGTMNYNLPHGWVLKCTRKLNYSLANKNGETTAALTEIFESSETGQLLAQRLVKWKPELSISEYQKLPNEYRSIIDRVLTTKPGSPDIKLVEPKK